jgi:major membrane immunogen (membrane-anchored lipoprotein)
MCAARSRLSTAPFGRCSRAIVRLVSVRNTSVVVALLGSCVLLAACGSSDRRLSANEYRARLTSLSQREDKAHADVEKAARSSSVAEIRSGLSKFAADQAANGNEVANLKPPKDAEAANALLARGLRDTSSEVRALVARLSRVKAPKAALTLINKTQTTRGGAETDRALSELQKKGYTKAS